MSDSEIEILTVLSRPANNWIVRLPGREYPAVVIQGDSLKIMFDLAEEILDLASESGELHDVATELRDSLKGRLELYEKALREHGVELPYTRPVT